MPRQRFIQRILCELLTGIVKEQKVPQSNKLGILSLKKNRFFFRWFLSALNLLYVNVYCKPLVKNRLCIKHL